MFVLWILLSMFLVVECETIVNSTNYCPNVKSSLSNIRKRRHLAFPEKSNVVLTISLVKAFMTHAPAGWNIALEIDVMYPLPDAKFTAAHSRRKLHLRQKRELWERIENAIEFHNINGHACVLRSICEARTFLAPPGRSLVHDILRAIFTAPLHDQQFIEEVGGAYDDLSDPNFCDKVNDCPFSLFHFVLSLNKQKY